MNSNGASGLEAVATPRGILKICLVALALTGLMVATGILLVTMLAERADAATWVRWGNVGQTFEAVNCVVSTLAVVGVLITWSFQSQQMQVAQLSLRRSVDAEVRNQHVTLIQMAIDDSDLAQVWPSAGGSEARTRRKYQYANLLIQHVWLQYTAGIASRDEMVSNLKYLFASPTVRAYWQDSRNSRQSIYVEGTDELGLASIADEIWAEYESVLACSAKIDPALDPIAGDPRREDLA